MDVAGAMVAEIWKRYHLTYSREEVVQPGFSKRLADATANPMVHGWFHGRIQSPDFLLEITCCEQSREGWAALALQPVQRRLVGPALAVPAQEAITHWLQRYGFWERCDYPRHLDGWVQQVNPQVMAVGNLRQQGELAEWQGDVRLAYCGSTALLDIAREISEHA